LRIRARLVEWCPAVGGEDIMRIRSAVASLVLFAAAAPASAYTLEQARACMDDAFRLCRTDIPNVKRVENCLTGKRQQLSKRCSVVFAKYRRASAEARHFRPLVPNLQTAEVLSGKSHRKKR
jgi:hypothetical protein